jgi:hypothetical protein
MRLRLAVLDLPKPDDMESGAGLLGSISRYSCIQLRSPLIQQSPDSLHFGSS